LSGLRYGWKTPHPEGKPVTAARLDVALIDSARAGEPAAIAELLVSARSELRRYAQRSCLISDVDDAVQESLLVLSRYLSSLRHARAWSRWVFRIVRRQCHRLARATLRQDLWDDEAVERFVAHKTEHDLRLDLAAAIESLPDSYRDVVVLRDFEGLTIGEMGEQLELSPASVKGRLRRARELTREYLLAQ
jgi:RNA polymerase sigma factor (sigma-70 family)